MGMAEQKQTPGLGFNNQNLQLASGSNVVYFCTSWLFVSGRKRLRDGQHYPADRVSSESCRDG